MRALCLALSLAALPADAQVPDVVTDIAPVQSLVAQVMGDLGAPGVLLKASDDPHHFQMRPSQARNLAGADLLIWMGPELTPWLDNARASVAQDARSLSLLDTDAPLILDGDKDHEHDDHSHGDLDPHAWLDPLNAAYYLGVIAAELSALDPENASTYRANATVAADGMKALHARIAPQLSPLRDTPLIATHDGFSYFLTRYDLTLVGTLSDSAGNAPGAAHLAELQTIILQADSPVCVLQEPGTSAEAILNLTSTKNALVVELDPHGRGLAQGPNLYGEMLTQLAETLATCADPPD